MLGGREGERGREAERQRGRENAAVEGGERNRTAPLTPMQTQCTHPLNASLCAAATSVADADDHLATASPRVEASKGLHEEILPAALVSAENVHAGLQKEDASALSVSNVLDNAMGGLFVSGKAASKETKELVAAGGGDVDERGPGDEGSQMPQERSTSKALPGSPNAAQAPPGGIIHPLLVQASPASNAAHTKGSTQAPPAGPAARFSAIKGTKALVQASPPPGGYAAKSPRTRNHKPSVDGAAQCAANPIKAFPKASNSKSESLSPRKPARGVSTYQWHTRAQAGAGANISSMYVDLVGRPGETLGKHLKVQAPGDAGKKLPQLDLHRLAVAQVLSLSRARVRALSLSCSLSLSHYLSRRDREREIVRELSLSLSLSVALSLSPSLSLSLPLSFSLSLSPSLFPNLSSCLFLIFPTLLTLFK